MLPVSIWSAECDVSNLLTGTVCHTTATLIHLSFGRPLTVILTLLLLTPLSWVLGRLRSSWRDQNFLSSCCPVCLNVAHIYHVKHPNLPLTSFCYYCSKVVLLLSGPLPLAVAVLVALVSTVASISSLWESSSDSDHVFPSLASSVETWGGRWAGRGGRPAERVRAICVGTKLGNARVLVSLPNPKVWTQAFLLVWDVLQLCSTCDRRSVCWTEVGTSWLCWYRVPVPLWKEATGVIQEPRTVDLSRFLKETTRMWLPSDNKDQP